MHKYTQIYLNAVSDPETFSKPCVCVQVQKVLQESLVTSSLQHLNLRGNDFNIPNKQLLAENGVAELVYLPHDLSTYGVGVSW